MGTFKYLHEIIFVFRFRGSDEIISINGLYLPYLKKLWKLNNMSKCIRLLSLQYNNTTRVNEINVKFLLSTSGRRCK